MSKRSIFHLIFLGLLITSDFVLIDAGKKSLLMGLILGASIRGRANEMGLLHVLIPLKLASDLWRQYGRQYPMMGPGYYDHHHYYGNPYFRRRR
ncbi:hypothetical protein QR98_0026530 [Sarcoptes scabiei]|uniref:Uncharacterized protein n=1 Tax=Sarcoptes scabiei TaxID=52283 RepID=A0A132A1I9_SARSC|nr:hypothetical protein QR98_0026530 [Sarcoptes scabiei]